jgi:hypothetical protein
MYECEHEMPLETPIQDAMKSLQKQIRNPEIIEFPPEPKAQQQQATSSATATPRAVLPQNDTVQQQPPQQPVVGFPPVASPLAFGSVNSYGNSGITAEKYQQVLAYMSQQQQPTTVTTSTETATASSTEGDDSYAEAKKKAAALGFDTTNMPNNYAELRAKQKKRHKKAMVKMLAKPKLYVPKPENKYDFYGSGEAST